jgi:hypothetical protein
LSINFEEIRPRAHGNFEEQNKVLGSSIIISNYCVIIIIIIINHLKPTCHVIHQQFNIQQLCVLPTLYLCVLYLSENKQRLVPLTA